MADHAGHEVPPAPPLAFDTVHFAGEGVALVVARDAASARDAVDAVEVDYDEREPVLDMEAALADGATLVHPELGTNRNALWVFDSGQAGSGGNVEDAIGDAEVVVRRRLRQQRLIPAFTEPRSVVVDPTGEQLTMWSSTQVPHIVRTMTALTLGLPEHKVRVIAPDVGGGFGGKLQVIPEEILTVLVARRMGKPVKWTETRSECMVAAHHGRDQIQDLTLSARKDGTVTGLKVELMANMGAYLRITPGTPLLGAFMYVGIYKFPAYHLAGKSSSVRGLPGHKPGTTGMARPCRVGGDPRDRSGSSSVRASQPAPVLPVTLPPSEEIDLLDAAGGAVAKRVVPAITALAVLALIIRWRRRRYPGTAGPSRSSASTMR